MFRIMGNTTNGPDVESNLPTRQAANNRLRMLKKHYPRKTFWIAESGRPTADLTPELNETRILPRIPKVTVTQIL